MLTGEDGSPIRQQHAASAARARASAGGDDGNVCPPRGIGEKSVLALRRHAVAHGDDTWAAVEAGAVQSEVLGMNFRFLTELANINDDEDLAAWLRKTLEHVFSTIEKQDDFTPPLLLGTPGEEDDDEDEDDRGA